jgi:hypothetical protein
MIITLVPEVEKLNFFEELQIILEKKKASDEVELSNLLRMVWTSTQNFDPEDKSKPKAFNGFEIWKEWIEGRIRLIKKLANPLTIFDKRKLASEGFEYFKKKQTVKTTETVRGQTFVSIKEV